jgi:hypothetical protein
LFLSNLNIFSIDSIISAKPESLLKILRLCLLDREIKI